MYKQLLLTFCSALFLLTACQNAEKSKADALIAIPETASMVTSINVRQLMEKADFPAVQKMAFYQNAIEQAKKENATLAAVLANPESSGIDLDKNIYVFNDIDAANPNAVFMGVVFSLADQDAFVKLVNSTPDANIQQRQGFTIGAQKNNGVVAWNEEIGVIGGGSGTIKVEDGLRKIFFTKEESSAATNEDLQDLLAENHDITSWMSSNSLAANNDARMALSLASINPDALNDNYIRSYANFENGEAVSKSDLVLNKELTKHLDLLFKDEVETDFAKYVPAENLTFASSFALDTKGINQLLAERPQAKSLADFSLRKYGLTTDDFLKTLGGDMVLAGYVMGEKEGEALFIASIAEQERLEGLLNKAVELGALFKTADKQYQAGGQMNIPGAPVNFSAAPQFLLQDDLLFITSNSAVINQIKAGGYATNEYISDNIQEQLTDHVVATYFDFAKLSNLNEEVKMEQIENLNGFIDRRNAEFKLELNDKNVNSLKAIFEMMNESYLRQEEKM